MKAERFGELDALRGLAALAVVVFHYTTNSANRGAPLFDFDAGKYGVQLFFCISGFVIYWTLERSRTLLDFGVSRFSRLYPAYWAALAILCVVEWVFRGQPPWLGGYVINATMLQAFAGMPDVDIVYWSLAVELAWYLWMAALFATGLLRHMTWVAIVWLSASCATSLTESPQWVQTFGIFQYAPYFLAGVMFYLTKRNGWSWKMGSVIMLAWVAAWFANGVTGAVVAGAVFAIFGLAVSGKLRWVANPVTAWLGAISYSLYLTHRAWGGVVLTSLMDAGVNHWVALAAAIVAAVLLASVITLTIERPALQFIRSRYRALPRGAQPAMP